MIVQELKKLRPLLVWQLETLRVSASTTWVCFEINGKRATIRGKIAGLRRELLRLTGNSDIPRMVTLAPNLTCSHHPQSQTGEEHMEFALDGERHVVEAKQTMVVMNDLCEWLCLARGTYEMPLGDYYYGVGDDEPGVIGVIVASGEFVIRTLEKKTLVRQLLAAAAMNEDIREQCIHDGHWPVYVMGREPRPCIHTGEKSLVLSRAAMVHLAATLSPQGGPA